MTRYALYFSPAPGSAWWTAGCRWLGRDPASGTVLPQPAIRDRPELTLAELTVDARRYGLHATLKAPFRLMPGFSEEHLQTMAQAFASAQTAVMLDETEVRPMGSFLALRPRGPHDALRSLAMRCTAYFDLLRDLPAAAEITKRRRAGLTERQDALLLRWGYPYTEEEFRFHMTLTDSLADAKDDVIQAVRDAAEQCFAEARLGPALVVDALTIFKEEMPGAPLTVWRRFPFQSHEMDGSIPAPGRLFFVVGPSGAGKDTLLQWVQVRLPADSNTIFARRTITRSVHPSESHEAVAPDQFCQLAAAGHFAMMWQANGLNYGIRRGIEADLKAGRDVVVNGSREYVPMLLQCFPEATVIWIVADGAMLRDRIHSRQREAGAAVLSRLERATAFSPPDELSALQIDNSGPIEFAGGRLLQILTRK